MARRRAHLPDAVVGLLPAPRDGVDHLLHEQVVRSERRPPATGDGVGELDDRAEHVELHLLRGGVADAHGRLPA